MEVVKTDEDGGCDESPPKRRRIAARAPVQEGNSPVKKTAPSPPSKKTVEKSKKRPAQLKSKKRDEVGVSAEHESIPAMAHVYYPKSLGYESHDGTSSSGEEWQPSPPPPKVS